MVRKDGGGDEQLAVGVGEAGVKWGRGLDRGKECGEGKMGLPGVEETQGPVRITGYIGIFGQRTTLGGLTKELRGSWLSMELPETCKRFGAARFELMVALLDCVRL